LLQLIRKRTLSVIMTEGIFSFVWMATVVDDTKVQTILVYDVLKLFVGLVNRLPLRHMWIVGHYQ
jgi:hypothetical protein